MGFFGFMMTKKLPKKPLFFESDSVLKKGRMLRWGFEPQ